MENTKHCTLLFVRKNVPDIILTSYKSLVENIDSVLSHILLNNKDIEILDIRPFTDPSISINDWHNYKYGQEMKEAIYDAQKISNEVLKENELSKYWDNKNYALEIFRLSTEFLVINTLRSLKEAYPTLKEVYPKEKYAIRFYKNKKSKESGIVSKYTTDSPEVAPIEPDKSWIKREKDKEAIKKYPENDYVDPQGIVRFL